MPVPNRPPPLPSSTLRVFSGPGVCVRGNNSRELDAEELDFRIGRIVPEHI